MFVCCPLDNFQRLNFIFYFAGQIIPCKSCPAVVAFEPSIISSQLPKKSLDCAFCGQKTVIPKEAVEVCKRDVITFEKVHSEKRAKEERAVVFCIGCVPFFSCCCCSS